MNRIIIGILFVLFIAGCSSPDDTARPNIVLILADDQGWADLSVNGNKNISTPNIDRIAAEGITFDRFFVSPVCAPTRAELLTGRYHLRGGVYDNSSGGERLDLDETTISEIFKQAGYTTAAYGKWHNGTQPPYHPNARGFDDFYGFCSGHWGNYFDPVLEHNGQVVKGNGYITDDLADHGIQFIEKNKDKPFFLYLPFNTPHSPMQVPDEWWKKFENKKLELVDKKEDENFTRASLAMTENLDYNVGRILEKIENAGLSENTIIIYMSDNGANSVRWNGGMKGTKGSTDEGGVRSPFFIRWKNRLQAGKQIKQIAAAIDLLPTLTAMAGIPFSPAKKPDGLNLLPLLFEENPPWKDRLIFSYWNNKTSVRNQRYRLDAANQLYDMEADPGQTTNITQSQPEMARQLIKSKEDWIQEVKGELPPHDDRAFTIGHPGFNFTNIPARDAVATGSIQRSSEHPNCSFFTNWTNTADSIAWQAEVLTEGDFEVTIWYTCAAADAGSTIELSWGDKQLRGKIVEAHDPPLEGMEHDRILRMESYVKDFRPQVLGNIHLKKGKGKLILRAIDIPGKRVMDFRMLEFRRI